MAFLNINGPIVANTAYSENVLVAKDVEFTLPEVTPIVAEVEAMGTMSLPIWARLEDMAMSIIKIGLDKGLTSMIKPGMKPLEFRFPQQVVDANGNTKVVACKAFIKAMPTSIPGIGVVPGEAVSSEIPMTATRYQLYIDGKEAFLIDRLASIVRIGGVDYSSGVQSML